MRAKSALNNRATEWQERKFSTQIADTGGTAQISGCLERKYDENWNGQGS